MQNYYFTFGIGHELSDQYQVIKAVDGLAAQRKMFEVYGKNWAFPYTTEEWDRGKREGWFKRLNPLPPIIVEWGE